MENDRLQQLEKKVRALYQTNTLSGDKWGEWLLTNHVLVVADYTTKLAARFSARAEIARAAALLHDIADAVMPRDTPEHESESLRIATQLLQETGYSDNDIALVVEDAIRYHSCHDGKAPQSLEGKILATADALGHLKTDFYLYAAWAFGKDRSLDAYKAWARKKIERDFHAKILFDEVKQETKHDYEILKELVAR